MERENRYDSLFQWYGELFGVDWLRLKAQAMAESNLDPMARSTAGALGLCQFMPATFEEYSAKMRLRSSNPYNPEHSIHCGAAYMHDLLRHYNGNWEKAWGAYNWGMGNVDRAPDSWAYPIETRAYIARCTSIFNSLIGQELA